MVHANDLYRLILVVRFTSDLISHIQHFNELLIDNCRQCFHQPISSLVTALYPCDPYTFINNLTESMKVYVNMLAVIMYLRILCEVYCRSIILIYSDCFDLVWLTWLRKPLIHMASCAAIYNTIYSDSVIDSTIILRRLDLYAISPSVR